MRFMSVRSRTWAADAGKSSREGGQSPVWSPDGGDLFYHNGQAAMSVPVTTEPSTLNLLRQSKRYFGVEVRRTGLPGEDVYGA